MGTYMSSPNTEKESHDNVAGGLGFGVSSMQGWRISQEDAHNCCPEFLANKKAALFAVYDGHGGAEVAEYTARHFPEFLKKFPAFQEGRIEEALKEAFLSFDATLVEEEVVKELKTLAQIDSDDEEEEEDELANLQTDAIMPLKQLLEKIKKVAAAEGEDLNGQSEDKEKNGSDNKSLHMNGNSVEENVKGKGDADTKEGEESTVQTDVVGETKQKANSEDTNCSANSAGSSAQTSIQEPASAAAGGDSTVTCATSSSSSSSGSACTAPSATGAEGSSSTGAGGSSSAGAGGSSSAGAGGSSSAGAEGSSSAAAGGTNEDGPCSSSGRKQRKVNKKAIPDEDEDETSMSDDDDDDSDEVDSDDSDLAEYKKALEENGSEDEEEGEEDDMDDMTGGEEPGFDSGCTAVVALKYDDTLYVANAGDSRCVLSRHGKAVDMSVDHKPEDDEELQRIQKAGGWVTSEGRVKGGLNLSRSLGDHTYKQNKELPDREQMISALPDVKTITLTEQDDFMVLACDGIWNVLSSQDVVTYVHDRLYGGYPVKKTSAICEELFHMCLAPDTTGDGTGCDNMTCIIIKFNEKSTAAPDATTASTTPAATSTATPVDAADSGSSKRAVDEEEQATGSEGQDVMDTAVSQDSKRARLDAEDEDIKEKQEQS